MFHVKNYKQAHLFDPWGHLGPKRRALLDNSWAGLFQQSILPALPVETLRKYYHDWNGRPSKELYSMLGLMIIQQALDLTDEQAVEQYCFNIQWHYALNITSPKDAASYISLKTLWSMRNKLTTEQAYLEIFEKTLKVLSKEFGTDQSKQRMDSVHIRSNMRRLGRIGLFVRTIKKFLVNLKRQHRACFDQLDKELVERYMSKRKASLFAMVRPSESSRTLDRLAEDVYALTQRFASIKPVHDMTSFEQLTRLFREQCVIEQDEHSSCPKAVARPNKEVKADSLQNPSDPDAGYSSHKGQGYQVQVVETYSSQEDPAQRQLSLITHVAVESADQHDANALLPALEALDQRDMLPDQCLADTLYGSDENCTEAEKRFGVSIISPVMPGNARNMSLADFTLDHDGRIVCCPNGIAPESVKQSNQGFRATFSQQACPYCKDRRFCKVTQGKKGCYLRYSHKDVRLARKRQFQETEVFRDTYRFRAGVEATMSEFDRLTGVKQLRVRGMKAVSFAAVMKAVGLNILRAARYKKVRKGGDPSNPPAFLSCFSFHWLIGIILTVKRTIATPLLRYQFSFF